MKLFSANELLANEFLAKEQGREWRTWRGMETFR